MSVKEKEKNITEEKEVEEEVYLDGIKTLSSSTEENPNRKHISPRRRHNKAVAKAKRKNRIIALVIILGLILVAAFPVYKFWFLPYSSNSQYTNLKNSFGKEDDSLPKDYLAKFGKLYTENKNIGGWILVAGTSINYPVMTQENKSSQYWENHLPGGLHNPDGSPFFVSSYKKDAENKNTVVFGNGSIMGELNNYLNIEFYKTSPIFSLDTLTSEGYYKVFAAFTTSESQARSFYNNDFKTDKEFGDFISEIGKNSVISTPVTVEAKDKIASIFTKTGNTYTAVFGRLMRDGEEAAMDTSSATSDKSGDAQPKLFVAPVVSEPVSNQKTAASAPNNTAVSSAPQTTSSQPQASVQSVAPNE